MPAKSLNLEEIPVIDNHCHAGMFEMLAGLDEGLSLADMRQIPLHAALQSAFPVKDYQAICSALQSEDEEHIAKLDAQYGFKKIVADLAVFPSRSNLYEILQEQAYRQIYGTAKDEQELEQSLMQTRRAGLIQTYIDMLDQSGIFMAFNFVLLPFGGSLVAFQRFDVANILTVIQDVLNIAAMVWLLSEGYGLVALAITLVVSMVLKHIASAWWLRRRFPEVRFSYRHSDKGTAR